MQKKKDKTAVDSSRKVSIFISAFLSLFVTGVIPVYAQESGVSRQVADVDPKIYNAYVGQYELAQNFIITITKEENRLFAQVTGQAKVEIFPESETKFFYKVVDAQITFVKDDKGKVTELILYQNGEHHAKKISDKVPDARKEIKLDPKIYDAYTGRYELTTNFIITISKDNNHLFAQATRQQKFKIYPESETKFFYKVVDAQITFVKNDKGVVEKLILHQNGEHHAKKIR